MGCFSPDILCEITKKGMGWTSLKENTLNSLHENNKENRKSMCLHVFYFLPNERTGIDLHCT